MLAVFYYSTGGDCDSPSFETFLPFKKALDMFGECAIDQSCDSTTANKAVKWFIDPENHPDDLGTDEQVWKVSSRIVYHLFNISSLSTGGGVNHMSPHHNQLNTTFH